MPIYAWIDADMIPTPSQVMLSVAPAGDAAGSTSLSGNLSRAKEETKKFTKDSDHLENIGMMIEAMENTLRSDMDGERERGAAAGAVFSSFRCKPATGDRRFRWGGVSHG